MVTDCIMAYPCLQNVVMCGNTFHMNEIEITEGYGNFQTPQKQIGHNALLTSTRCHTRYHTFSLSLTWIGHNATCYHNFSVLLHALPYIFSQFSMVCGYLQRITSVTVKFIKKYILMFFKRMTVTCGNVLQIAQNQANLRKNIW